MKERRYAEVNEDRVRGEEVSVGGEEELEEKEGGWEWTWAWTFREGVWVECWVKNDVFFSFSFFFVKMSVKFLGTCGFPFVCFTQSTLEWKWCICWIKSMSSSYRRKLSLRWGDEVFLPLVVMIIIRKKVSHGTINKLQNTIRLVLTFHLQSLLTWKASGKPSYSDRSIGLKQRLFFFLFRKNGTRQLKSAPQLYLFARVSPTIVPTRTRKWYINGLM